MSKNSSISNNSVYYKYTGYMSKTVLFQIIQFSISTQFKCQKILLLPTIQFSINTQFSSIWPIHSELRSDDNEGVFCISQISSITGTSPSDYLVSYPGHWFGDEGLTFSEKQLVYSTTPADWDKLC